MPFVIAVLAAAVLFGTTGTSQALGPEGTTPFTVGGVRLVIGGTALAALTAAAAWLRRRRNPGAARPRATARPVGLMALTAVCLTVYQPLFFLGTSLNGVAVGTVIALGSSPVIAGVIEGVLHRRLPSGIWMSATALATVGVVLLGVGGGGEVAADPVGVLGSIGAGASFAVLAVAQRRLLDDGWHPFTVVGSMGGGSAVLAIPFLFAGDLSWLGEPRGVVMALWLGLATVTVAYALFTWGLGGLSAAAAATLTLGEPLTASVLGLAVLHEQLAPLAIAGLVVLGAGLALLARGSRAPRDPEPFAVEG
ncbi:DMT family transporter [Microbacterium sediminis]|uniref:DMT family transporter n=1 Tax=Microbacterium sediminis TaxID=904291 RepID=UPI001071D644|nr:EamA family transporter [Microbacterium sediminis]QBR74733.1 EamA/RhaT family transporter [Microbacterium sediminis]